ncbi:MAG: hypothetical protein IJR59_06380 [Firmicutes bacterium]|nr:hypothetical protein [Bacillota bacterium]
MELWRDHGIASYNWGYSNCTPAENYYLLQDILKYTKPKLIVFDVYGIAEYESYPNGKYRTDRIEQQHVQFDSFPLWSKAKYQASKDVFDIYPNNSDFVCNFLMYHNRWSELDKNDFDYEITTEKGAHFLTGLGTANFTPIDKSEKAEINTVCCSYYLKILDYCNTNNIKVLCVYIPFAADENQQRIANTMGDLIKDYPNCSYVNMLNENIIDYNTDVCPDNVHINYSGASKITTWFGNYLRKNYNLDNYKDNEYWLNDYNEYHKYKGEVITSLDEFTAYLVQLYDKDFSADVYIYDKDLAKNKNLQQLLENAQIKPKYGKKDGNICVRLVIKSNLTNEVIDDIGFEYVASGGGIDCMQLKKIAEKE